MMAKQVINIGIAANDRSGDPIRTAFNKVNQNFNELYTLTGGTAADLQELAQDYASPLFTHNYHTGISFTYDDINNRLVAVVSDNDSSYVTSTSLSLALSEYSTTSLINGSYTVSLNSDGTLTLPSSSNTLYITTNALIKSISNIQISSGDDIGSNWIFDVTGTLSTPRDQLYGGAIIDPSHTTEILSSISIPTAIWTSSNPSVYSVKATVSVFFGLSDSIDTQTCEMLITRREYYDGITWTYTAVATDYGVIHTTTDPITTLDVKCNSNGLIQITAMKDLGMTGVNYFVQVVAQEIYKD